MRLESGSRLWREKEKELQRRKEGREGRKKEEWRSSSLGVECLSNNGCCLFIPARQGLLRGCVGRGGGGMLAGRVGDCGGVEGER